MAFIIYLHLLLFLLGVVCWAESVNVRPSTESAALARRNPTTKTFTHDRVSEPTKDLELLDIVLVATVDGKFHALSRTLGRTLWSMPSFTLTGAAMSPSGLAPLVRTQHTDYDPDEFDDSMASETYIIEPQSGDIYVVNPADNSLQRFPFSMPELVDLSPFTAPGDDERRVFIGRKETSLLLLELETGKIKATLNSECPPYEDKINDLNGKDSKRPSTTDVYIGRTGKYLCYPGTPILTLISSDCWADYYISIYSQGGSRYGQQPPVQNLSFSVYGPNNMDNMLQATYRRTNDNTYIQGLPNGEIISFRTKSDGTRVDSQPLWVQSFQTPTVAVFDVLKGPTPLHHTPHAFLLLQPRPRVEDVLPGIDTKLLRNGKSAYVGMVEETGSLYVLSPTHFPLVAFGTSESNDRPRLIDAPGTPSSPRSIHDIIRDTEEAGRRTKCEENPHDRQCLLGMLSLDQTNGHESRIRRLLEGPSSINPVPTLRPAQQWMDHGIEIVGNLEPPPNSSQPATSIITEEVRKTNWEFMAATIGLGMFSLWFLFKKFGQREGHKAIKLIASLNGEMHEAKVAPPSVLKDTPKPSPGLVQDSITVPEPPTPPAPSIDGPPSESGPSGPIAGSAEEGDDTDREVDGEAQATPGKKKPRRGKRGKKKKKDSMAVAEDENGDANAADGPALNGVPEPATPSAPQTPLLILAPSTAPAVAPSLVVSETILGFGSHGTVVYQGSLQGRAVAVKRLLKDFVTLASREVSILQESDDHPNVIRYYYQEAHANFLYIALELCPASLADIIECPDRDAFRDIAISFDPKKALKQITSGLKHLHALRIVHRDIKPQNILISTNKSNARGRPTYRMLISDFGLCKRLDTDQTSFLPTVNGGLGAGTVGWRAPEILRGEVKLDDLSDDHSLSSRGSVSTVNGSNSSSTPSTAKPTRLTKSVDIFALGCLYYYTLSNGSHPYGDRFEREVNILKDSKSLDLLERFGEEGTEACDLISQMLNPESPERPDTTACLLHPFFWDPARRLNFLQDASDRFEIMCRDPKDPNLLELENGAIFVVGNDWQGRLDKVFLENLGKFRKYDGKSVQDLLRALRNKKNHYQDLPDNVKRHLGPMPEGFLGYFTKRFPRLFLHVHKVIKDTGLRTESMFRAYFELPDS